ncbi:hypothetical protein AAF463_11435 [Pantoea sp. BJ2]|uniref:Uncharacterized protein n=1 Tax=Pantoea sp. BJ2 TaxID=3141322 RepID=A0AAU7TRS8_9GAMM
MNEVLVRTKSELDAARKNKSSMIIIEGELAKKVKKSKKIAYAGVGTLGVIGVAIAAVPVTGGMSMFAAAPVAALTGFEIAAILAACFVGLGLLVALFKDYEEVEFDGKKLRMVLKRKQS